MKPIFSIFENEIHKIDEAIKNLHVCEVLHTLGAVDRDEFFKCYDDFKFILERFVRHCPPVKSDLKDVSLVLGVAKGILDKILKRAFKLPYEFQTEVIEVVDVFHNSIKVLENYCEPLITIDDEAHPMSPLDEKVYISDELQNTLYEHIGISADQLKRHVKLIDEAINGFKKVIQYELEARESELTDSSRVDLNNALDLVVKNVLSFRKEKGKTELA